MPGLLHGGAASTSGLPPSTGPPLEELPLEELDEPELPPPELPPPELPPEEEVDEPPPEEAPEDPPLEAPASPFVVAPSPGAGSVPSIDAEAKRPVSPAPLHATAARARIADEVTTSARGVISASLLGPACGPVHSPELALDVCARSRAAKILGNRMVGEPSPPAVAGVLQRLS